MKQRKSSKSNHVSLTYNLSLNKRGKLKEKERVFLIRDIPKIIKFKATTSLRISCLFCIFKHSPQKTV
ncbi:hypothetical protein BACFIN_09182 [Bacteroides finegoldii DSM 17565]|nr:hypothetical protein BACFIN_09182 [Bacteroides finegoldii DSM 17565]